jgi:hypothetical protein
MSKEDQQPIDNLEEEYIKPSEYIASAKISSGDSEESPDSNTPNLEDIRTAGL